MLMRFTIRREEIKHNRENGGLQYTRIRLVLHFPQLFLPDFFFFCSSSSSSLFLFALYNRLSLVPVHVYLHKDSEIRICTDEIQVKRLVREILSTVAWFSFPMRALGEASSNKRRTFDAHRFVDRTHSIRFTFEVTFPALGPLVTTYRFDIGSHICDDFEIV